MFKFTKKSNNYPKMASNILIDARTNKFRTIVPNNLDYAVRSVYPIIKTELESSLTVNTIYDLGLQTNISFTTPQGKMGDFIQIDFISGNTPTTLSVTTPFGLIGYDFTPEASYVYSLYFDWGIINSDNTGANSRYGWRFNYSEYKIILDTSHSGGGGSY